MESGRKERKSFDKCSLHFVLKSVIEFLAGSNRYESLLMDDQVV